MSTPPTQAVCASTAGELAASVFDHSRDAIMITAPDGAILAVNRAFCTITGYTEDEVRGKNPRILKSGLQDRAFYASMWQAITSKGYWQGEAWNRRKDGTLFAERLTIVGVPGADGKPHHYIAMFADVTGASMQRRRLEERANYDALTGLPNRVLLGERLEQLLACARDTSFGVALAFIDLDGFKQVNDSMGHPAGDRLLASIGQSLRAALRGSDTLARFGGDEFVAVLPDMCDDALLASLLARVADAARAPIVIDGRAICLSASIGVALFPRDGTTPAQLISHADAAMYAAKRATRGGAPHITISAASPASGQRHHHEVPPP
ncbi:diguanylate cyclase (GGDEF)-like protein/PAS domain S-box-containing protein [Massilia sp. MP_M2]|uniref:diguanylate cyclase domain-containing protein n=1 Tax=Massilia sp. MP_M2 TaxID=3071713 RepID=UPI00319D9D28